MLCSKKKLSYQNHIHLALDVFCNFVYRSVRIDGVMIQNSPIREVYFKTVGHFIFVIDPVLVNVTSLYA